MTMRSSKRTTRESQLVVDWHLFQVEVQSLEMEMELRKPQLLEVKG